jgi:hypothetical protein
MASISDKEPNLIEHAKRNEDFANRILAHWSIPGPASGQVLFSGCVLESR